MTRARGWVIGGVALAAVGFALIAPVVPVPAATRTASGTAHLEPVGDAGCVDVEASAEVEIEARRPLLDVVGIRLVLDPLVWSHAIVVDRRCSPTVDEAVLTVGARCADDAVVDLRRDEAVARFCGGNQLVTWGAWDEDAAAMTGGTQVYLDGGLVVGDWCAPLEVIALERRESGGGEVVTSAQASARICVDAS